MIVNFIKQFPDATRIDTAALAYSDADTAVDDVRAAIKTQAHKLADVWEGPASVEAQQALGILWVTMGELADKLKKMSESVSALATVVRKHQAFIDDDAKGILSTWQNQGGLGGSYDDSIWFSYATYTGVYGGDNAVTGWGSANELAGRHLATFSSDLSHIHVMIPDTVEKVLRDIHPPQEPQEDPVPIDYTPFGDGGNEGGLTPTSYGGADLSTGPTGGLDTTAPSFGGTDPSTDSPNTPGYPGTDPSGDSSTDSPTTPDPTNPNGQDPNSQNPGGQNPGAGTNTPTSLQDYRPTTPTTATVPTTNPYGGPGSSYGPGTTGGPGGVYGGGSGLVPTGGAPGTGGRYGNGTGMPFMPMGGMGGGAGGQESQDREASTWLHEDDDVWGGDSDSAVNDRIG
ncbi:hypothetical protein ACTWPT_06135 [Nonomuraea sp. 3N208]|uniref:hypothetical protein n=1 Tax=Nonomuraea sp. 3N208 TaxID=3457421 RepID=UPI003FCE6AC7